MKRILVDMLRRRWWLFVALPVFSSPLLAPGLQVLMALAVIVFCYLGALILAASELGQGVARCYAALPVSGRTVSRTLWLEYVVLLPLCYLCLEFLGCIGSGGTAARLLLLFSTGLLGMGFLGVLWMIGLLYRPAGTSGHFSTDAWAFIRGWLALILMLAVLAATVYLAGGPPKPRHGDAKLLRSIARVFSEKLLETQDPVRALILGAALVAIGLSYRLSAMTTGKMMLFPMGTQRRVFVHGTRQPVVFRPRILGYLWPWFKGAGAFLWAIFISCVAVYWPGIGMEREIPGVIDNLLQEHTLVTGFMMFVLLLLLVSTGVWLNCIRVLRSLPLSSTRLTAWVLSMPVLGFFLIALTLAIALHAPGQAELLARFLRALVLCLSVSCVGCALLARTGYIALLLIVPASAVLPYLADKLPHGTVLLSVLLIALGFTLFRRVIASSSAAYHRRIPLEGQIHL